MNQHNHLLYVLLLVSGGLFACGALPSDESADGSYRWEEFPVSYYLAKSFPAEYRREVHAAFADWEAAVGHNLFAFAGYLDLSDEQLGNGNHPLKNVVMATERSGKVKAPYGDGYDAIARTLIHGATAIHDADVVFFGFTKNYVEGRGEERDVYSVRTVMLHEIGRMLFGDRSGADDESVLNNPVYPQGHELERIRVSAGDVELFYETYGDLL